MRSGLRAVVLTLVVAASAVSAACAAGGASAGAGIGMGGFALQVENDQFDAVTVVLLRGGSALRVGHVDGFGRRTFRVPPSYMGTGSAIMLRAEPRGAGAAQRSMPFDVAPGQTVRWTVRAASATSSLIVR